MITLKQIVPNSEYRIFGNEEVQVERLILDSRIATRGDLFAALKGTSNDGHQYIPQVIEKGVTCVLCEMLPDPIPAGVTVIQVPDSHQALGIMASKFYGEPSSHFKLVGVTGTNGKTSIATLLHRLFTKLGFKVGLFSTVKNLIGEKVIEATHTTPDPITINRLMAEMVAEGCDYVFMEVSSHSVDQKRIAGLQFDGAIFTNITHDHLDYHLTFDNYIKAKKGFFDSLDKKAFALVNIDDKRGMVMVQNTVAAIKTFSLQKMADFKGKVIECHFDGTLLHVNDKEIWTRLIGQFNASNLLAVYGAACLLYSDEQEILKHISSLETVTGRFEYVKSPNGITAVVDYAHTPDAIKNVIDTINNIRTGTSKLITVVGAGGNRDKTKRPEMARLAVSGSDKVILTSDNPRNEEPQAIIDDMIKGVAGTSSAKVLSIVDRREAIRTACMLAAKGDIILVAGKGHETYQEIKGVKSHFSDKEVIEEFFMSDLFKQQ